MLISCNDTHTIRPRDLGVFIKGFIEFSMLTLVQNLGGIRTCVS